MHKLKDMLLGQLRQGTTPDKLALTLVVGMALGTIPILGSTTLLCLAAAMALRLNVALLQLVNYFVYPLQLILYIPLLLLGARMLDPAIGPLSLPMVYDMLRSDLWGSIQRLFLANLGAVLIWAGVAIPNGLILFTLLRRGVRNLQGKMSAEI